MISLVGAGMRKMKLCRLCQLSTSIPSRGSHLIKYDDRSSTQLVTTPLYDYLALCSPTTPSNVYVADSLKGQC